MSDSIDQQFVEFVVKALVGNPEAVSVERTIDEKGVLLALTVDPEDLGRVIGKRGGTAQSIRTLLRALGTKNDARYNLKIVDTDGGSGATQPQSQSQARDDDSSSDDSYQTTDNEDSMQSTDESEDTTAVEESSDNPVEEDEPETVENDDSDYEKKHRKELADLDDLDI